MAENDAQQVAKTPSERLEELTSVLGLSQDQKDEAIEIAMANVSDQAIEAVANALDRAIPTWIWNAHHVHNPQAVTEHAIEEGRASVVNSLKKLLRKRQKAAPKS